MCAANVALPPPPPPPPPILLSNGALPSIFDEGPGDIHPGNVKASILFCWLACAIREGAPRDHHEQGVRFVDRSPRGPSAVQKQQDVEFCAEHKKKGTMDANSKKRCGHPSCDKKPSYGVEGSKAREFCAEHKKEGMVDLKSKRCGHPDCNKHPSYGVEGSKMKEFCAEHKKEGMVHLASTVGGVGEGKKRKDRARPAAEGKSSYASKRTKRTNTPAIVKVEDDAETSILPGAAEAVRYVLRGA